MSQKFNDKTNPQVVMVAYMLPTQIHIAIAKALRFRPSPVLAVFLDRASNEFRIAEVH